MASHTPKPSDRRRGQTNSNATSKTTSAAPTKLERLVALLRRKGGATLEELCTATGWQPHSVRGAIAGTLKKKGHAITSERIDGVRRYRIGDPE
ncbi:MAG: DUF3489 domain-containing protein [Sneathiella sp.]|nr:DUF3489 domain-containing protein [Sneathiella sp.]